MSGLLLVMAGGFFGSILRFFLADILHKSIIATLIANLSGSILLAILFRLSLANEIPTSLWLFAGIGFCGAYTTFSTFSNEVLQLMLRKRYIKAAAYGGSSFVLSLVAFFTVMQV